jgi:hypothetical protein
MSMHHSAHLPNCVTPLLAYIQPIWWIHGKFIFRLYKMVILVHFSGDFLCGIINFWKKGDHQTEIHTTLLNVDYLRPTVFFLRD